MTRRLLALLAAAVLLFAAMPGSSAFAHHHDWDDDDDDEVIWGYIIVLALVGISSPFWVPWAMTEESYTMEMDTRFHEYPYKDGAEGFISLEKGDRRGITFVEFGGGIAGEDEGFSITGELLTYNRFALHYNQAYYRVDDHDDVGRGASSLHGAYIFARNEHWAFCVGAGGRYEHRPIGHTTLSGVYTVDWFPVQPMRLTGRYEFDGESHFRVSASALWKKFGFGIALRSEVIDETRYQQPELFVSTQF